MLNGKATHEASRVGSLEPIHKLLVGAQPKLDSAVRLAYREILTREPTAEEIAEAKAIIGDGKSLMDGMADLDGGVHSPTNADRLADSDLELVIVSSPMSVDVRSVRPRVDLAMRLRFQQILRSETWVLRRRGLRIVARRLEVILRLTPLARELVRPLELLQASPRLRRLAVVVVDGRVGHALLRLRVRALQLVNELFDPRHHGEG